MKDEDFLPLIFRNLDELRYRLVRILIVFGAFFVFFLSFSYTQIIVLGHSIPFVTFDVYHNIPAQFLALLEAHVLPPGTKIITLTPTAGVSADVYIAMFLSLLFAMPHIVYQIGKFIGPALKKSEQQLIRTITIPSALLFAAGSIMGIWIVAPVIFKIFQDFNVGLGAESTMGIMSFVSFRLIYVITFGISFEVPVFMYGLTRSGMVSSDLWSRNWRYAVIGALIYGMIFSPGVLGFTMMLMALPMMLLYFSGIYFARRYERNAKIKESEPVPESL